MTRWTLVFLLVSSGTLLAGCGDQGAEWMAPSSPSAGNQDDVGLAPPPPPPPPGGKGSGGPVPAGSAAAGGRLDTAFEELIAVLNQISDLLSGVNDEPSAKAVAPKYLSLSRRRNGLQQEIARLRLQLNDEGAAVAQKYSGRVKTAAESAAAAQARLIGNAQMLAMWGKALQAAQQASPPPPPPPTAQGGSDSAAEQFGALQTEMVGVFRQIVDLLSTVKDDATARGAAPKLRQYARDLERSGKRLKLFMASLSPQDRQRLLMAEMDGAKDNAELGQRMDEEIVRVAADPAAAALGAEINELLNALDGLQRGYRQGLEKEIQRARGGR